MGLGAEHFQVFFVGGAFGKRGEQWPAKGSESERGNVENRSGREKMAYTPRGGRPQGRGGFSPRGGVSKVSPGIRGSELANPLRPPAGIRGTRGSGAGLDLLDALRWIAPPRSTACRRFDRAKLSFLSFRAAGHLLTSFVIIVILSVCRSSALHEEEEGAGADSGDRPEEAEADSGDRPEAAEAAEEEEGAGAEEGAVGAE